MNESKVMQFSIQILFDFLDCIHLFNETKLENYIQILMRIFENFLQIFLLIFFFIANPSHKLQIEVSRSLSHFT